MKTITIYELLGLIKDGKAPKKIKTENIIYELNDEKAIWVDRVYHEANKKNIWLSFTHIKSLNAEVEIIEEEKEKNFTGWKVYQDGKEVFSIEHSAEEEKKIPEKLENEHEFYSYAKYKEYKNEVDKVLYILKAINLAEEKIGNLNNSINKIIDYLKSKGE